MVHGQNLPSPIKCWLNIVFAYFWFNLIFSRSLIRIIYFNIFFIITIKIEGYHFLKIKNVFIHVCSINNYSLVSYKINCFTFLSIILWLYIWIIFILYVLHILSLAIFRGGTILVLLYNLLFDNLFLSLLFFFFGWIC